MKNKNACASFAHDGNMVFIYQDGPDSFTVSEFDPCFPLTSEWEDSGFTLGCLFEMYGAFTIA